MNTIRTSSLWVAMATAFALSTGALAATPAEEEHDAHHPDQEQAEAVSPDVAGATMPMRMQAMQERMKMMRETRDPQERMRMMEEQMADLDSAMKGMADCPMMSGDMPMGRMGMGPMGGGGMMQRQGGMGMGGMGMMQRRGEAMHDGGMMMQHHPGMMGKRLDSMEKRLDLMQSIIESHMARGGRMMQ